MKKEKAGMLFSKFLVFIGILCILSSLAFYILIYFEDINSYEEFKESIINFQNVSNSLSIEEIMEIEKKKSDLEFALLNWDMAEAVLYVGNEEEIAVDVEPIIINDEPYMGVLKIDSINMALPIHEIWTDEKLDTAPCVYDGSLYTKDLIVGAHNTKAHFSMLSKLDIGAEAIITDGNGQEFKFTLKEFEVIPETEVRTLMNIKRYELTLFTCDSDSRKRLIQRWSLV